MTQPNKTMRSIGYHAGPPPEIEKVILEKETPSDVALVTPLIIRICEFLSAEAILTPEFQNKFQLCLDEALRNAVIHGNKREFKKRVKLTVFLNDTRWGVQIEDEGEGFVPAKVPDPLDERQLWGENGRGLHLMAYYMDQVDYYSSGKVLKLQKDL